MTSYPVEPDAAQQQAFDALSRSEPFQMLNLVRLRDLAAYPADHPAAAEGLSGAEAYGRYLAAAAPLFEHAGGRMIWTGRPEGVFIGLEGDRWDIAMIVEYPSAEVFAAEEQDPVYQAATVHRFAGVLAQIAVRCAPTEQGSSLAGGV